MKIKSAVLSVLFVSVCCVVASAQYTEEQLGRWLARFPAADANGDGQLTAAEADLYRRKMRTPQQSRNGQRKGAPREFQVDPRWPTKRFPEYAVCYKSADEIAAIYQAVSRSGGDIISYPKPQDGSLRIVGTGHSFMGPGYKTFPLIAAAAGLDQPSLLTHTGGGITGSARYKWEQENGIFQFDRKPTPKLLASIANAQWDAMMWGPYFNDRPEYYSCWMDFCLRYNPGMKFYLSDAWPQLDQLEQIPTSEEALTRDVFVSMAKEKFESCTKLVGSLNEEYPGKVFVMPTCAAMVLAVERYLQGDLPGVQGIHAMIGKQERSLWRDRLGHLGPGFGQLEGYVFYATLYGRSPEKIDRDVRFDKARDYPSPELDRIFREIAWQAVLRNPLSGITDNNENGVCDSRE